jgi:arginine decarboxylase
MEQYLLNAMLAYQKRDIFPFHTPGHKGSWYLPGLHNIEHLAKADIADDIDTFPEAFYNSEKEVSKVYKTQKSFYLVNGSTSGIIAMFLASLKPGDKVIVGRNMHMSAISALIMTGAIPVYIEPVKDKDGIPLNVLASDVINAIESNKDAKAVFLTSPSYTGVCFDISEISHCAHKHGMLTLVDEAWGAHLPFGEGFPRSSLEQGADLVVHGAHKTLPTLTGSALLHLNSFRIDEEKLDDSLRIVETTSPNTLMYLSLENAVNIMEEKGKELLDRSKKSVEIILDRLKDEIVFQYNFPPNRNPYLNLFSFDPSKILLRTGYKHNGITGYEVAEFLNANHGIVCELADLETVLFIFTGYEEDGGEGFLSYAIKHASGKLSKKSEKNSKIYLNSKHCAPLARMILNPRDAHFSKTEEIPFLSSKGRISGSLVVPYPPGIPALIPGEEITGEIIENLMEILNAGGNIKGISFRDDLEHIRVVK